MSEQTEAPASEQWGPVARVFLGAGVFISTVSVGLFIHTISQLASPIVCGIFIAAGVVGGQRATTPLARIASYSAIAGGAVAFVGSLVLAAIGR